MYCPKCKTIPENITAYGVGPFEEFTIWSCYDCDFKWKGDDKDVIMGFTYDDCPEGSLSCIEWGSGNEDDGAGGYELRIYMSYLMHKHGKEKVLKMIDFLEKHGNPVHPVSLDLDWCTDD